MRALIKKRKRMYENKVIQYQKKISALEYELRINVQQYCETHLGHNFVDKTRASDCGKYTYTIFVCKNCGCHKIQ